MVRWLIFGSTLFSILYSIHVLIGYQTSSTQDCSFTVNNDYALFYSIQITVSSILPFIIMVIFSVFTLRNVRHVKRRIEVNLENSGRLTTIVAATILPQNINRRRREVQLIKISILQVTFYAILSMISTCYPLYSILTISQKKSSNQTAIDTFLNNTGLLLMYTYNAVCFICIS